MRIIQIIDSLEVGGAEKMAINYANALAQRIEFSGLIATRKEGDLKSQINENVDYFYLNKKKAIDLKAILRLKFYCKKNKVEIVQPHSSSYFTAFLLKLIYPKIQIIWHDHNGLSEFLGSQKWIPLKVASFFFKSIIVVNDRLKKWAEKELFCKNVIYLPNFTNKENNIHKETILKGESGKRIICLANLRYQKNHFLLLKLAEKLKKSHSDWSFHLVGKDFQDDYSVRLKQLIKNKKLEHTVYLYGTKNDITHILSQSEIAILTSKSEGLPVALLEYGLNRKPVVVTKVGEMPMIIENGVNGYLVESGDVTEFYESLKKLIEDADRNRFGENLYHKIKKDYGEDGVLYTYLQWTKTL